ncbi:MAG: ATP-binding cassette domain-containing protein [Actinomycetota bacterium]|nr:ATP-binding cassette domain-containing protein [Actinomycetota bacterium]
MVKKFEGVTALRNGNIKIEGAKICGLVGANGSGKTTFARICAGLVKKDDGQIYIDGKEVDINSPFDARKYGIVLVHQNLSLIPDLSVWENINLGHEKRSKKIFFDNEYAMKKSEEILKDLSPRGISINQKVADLTPSEMQVVGNSKALSQNPRLLILDEPTAALEYFQVEKLIAKVKELKEQDIYIIFISHRLWEVTEICDHGLYFQKWGNCRGYRF